MFRAESRALERARNRARARRLGTREPGGACSDRSVLDRMRRLTLQFPAPSQPGRVLLALEPWTMENTLLTPTLKLKRLNLDARFDKQIDELYKRR